MTQGLRRPIADYWLRPWILRLIQTRKGSSECKNLSTAKRLLQVQAEFMRKLNRTCHFSLAFPSALTHDTNDNLGLLDTALYQHVIGLDRAGALNHTVLFILGDHGQRIQEDIKRSFIGRLEERMPFLAVRFPPWFLHRHTHIRTALHANRHRFATNYDLHKLLRDIAASRFDQTEAPSQLLGTSLFMPLPHNRSCADLDVPLRYCTCLLPSSTKPQPKLIRDASHLLQNHLKLTLPQSRFCSRLFPFSVNGSNFLTVNDHVRHGLVYMTAAELKLARTSPMKEIEYLELDTWHPRLHIFLRTRFEVFLRKRPNSCPRGPQLNVPPLLLRPIPASQLRLCPAAAQLPNDSHTSLAQLCQLCLSHHS